MNFFSFIYRSQFPNAQSTVTTSNDPLFVSCAGSPTTFAALRPMEPSSQQNSRGSTSSRRRGLHLIGIFFVTICSSVVETDAELDRPDASNTIQQGQRPAYAASNTIIYPGIDSYRSNNRLRSGLYNEQYIWQRLLQGKKSGSSGTSTMDSLEYSY